MGGNASNSRAVHAIGREPALVCSKCHWGLLALCFLLINVLPAPVLAQDIRDPFSSQIMGVEDQPILVLNQERLLRTSKAGQALLRKETQLKEGHRNEGLQLDKELESEELELTRMRDELVTEEFDKLAIKFDAKVVAVRRDHQEKTERLATELEDMRKSFFTDIIPIVAEIMRERGASLVFEQRNVLFTGPDVDITAEVIDRLDRQAGLQ